jgi:hypothetical protein
MPKPAQPYPVPKPPGGLTEKQKKNLPIALQEAILRKKGMKK